MSFVNKIKGWGQKGGADQSALDGDVAVADDYSPRRQLRRCKPQPTCPLPTSKRPPRSTRCRSTATAPRRRPRSSREVVPSESADFTETRLQGADAGAAPLGAGLPLIGDRPVGEQQRILLGAARRRPGRPGRPDDSSRSSRPAAARRRSAATGQALMQSQRLAKSVSQALIGSAAGLPRSEGQRRGARAATCAA